MASGWEMSVGDKEYKFGPMEPSTKAHGKTVRPMVTVLKPSLRKVYPRRWRRLRRSMEGR